MEILTKLGIDWQQIVAQIVNFGVIATVLMILVYKPLLRTIDERRARIQQSLKDAEQVEAKMKDIEHLKNERLKKADQEAGSMLERAKKDAEALKADMLSSAQKEAEALLTKARTQIESERRKVYEDAQKNLTRMVVKMTEKVLAREFTPSDNDRLLGLLEKELTSLKTL